MTAKRSGMYFLYDLLHISAAKNKYNSVKDDPELSESIVSYGWMGVFNALFAFGASFGFAWGLSLLLIVSIGNYILGWVLVAIFAIVLLTQIISAAINTVWQLKLNKKKVGYFALLCVLLSVVGIVLTLTLFRL